MPKLKRDLTMEQQLAAAPVDLPFLMLVVLLTVIGVITVFSASYPTAINEGAKPTTYFTHQAIYACLGLFLMYAASRVNYQYYRPLSILLLGIALVLLVLVLIPGVHTVRSDNVKRWIRRIGPIPSFQPSELAKLGVIMFFSARMSRRHEMKRTQYDPNVYLGRFPAGKVMQKLEDWGFLELVPYGLILLIIVLLMKAEPHMSGTILILIPAAAILFAGGIGWHWIAIGGTVVSAGLWFIIQNTDYMAMRLQVQADPWANPQHGGYQIIQSLYAIGSGGLFGVGFGQGRQKQLFLPEAENDFIFSVWCEEMGLVGAYVVLVLFLLLILRGYWIALHARDPFGSLLVVGITTLMAAQVFLNISVVTNFLPTTGVSLPFFSYGGTALVIQLIEMGIVLGVSRQMPAPKQE